MNNSKDSYNTSFSNNCNPEDENTNNSCFLKRNNSKIAEIAQDLESQVSMIRGNDPEDEKIFDEIWKSYFLGENCLKKEFQQISLSFYIVLKSVNDFEKCFNFSPKKKNFKGFKEVIFNFEILENLQKENKKFLFIIQSFKMLYYIPQDFINCLSMAFDAYQTNIKKMKRKKIICRIINFGLISSIKELKSGNINQFVTVRGVILRTSPIKLLPVSMIFTCSECKAQCLKYFVDGNFNPPKQCSNLNCKLRIFYPLKHTCKTIFFQRIKLQENNDFSGVPEIIEVELKENLVNTILSGDHIQVSGILKTELNDEKKGFAKQQRLYISYIDAISIIQTKDVANKSVKSLSPLDTQITENDFKKMEFLIENQTIFPLLIRSFCPSIFGNELVKAGILLAIVGGSVLENSKSNGNSSFRSDCHVLIVGDPSLGKSQMLKFAANITSRSVYVCGNATTSAGLTVTATKDSSNESSLEAGALVLSDNGVCCIDEFDKMSNEHVALLEAMEQQTISVAKCGILTSLQTKCSILASANPIENVKISNAILSRFDLIFLLTDKADLIKDQKMSEHIMKLHKWGGKRKREDFENYESCTQFEKKFSKDCKNTKGSEDIIFNERFDSQNTYINLKERYSKMINEKLSILEPSFLKKYLEYVKNNFNPKLSEEASRILKSHYLNLKKSNDTGITITPRHLESLVRLSQARAKIEARNIVSENDAIEVVELMQESLFSALNENISKQEAQKQIFNIATSNIGGFSVPKQRKFFIEKLRNEVIESSTTIFTLEDLRAIYKALNMNVGSFLDFIDRLNNENIILKKGGNEYEFADN